MLFHVDTDSPPWTSAHTSLVDLILKGQDSHSLELNWDKYAYELDGEHFTDAGFDDFSSDMVDAVCNALPSARKLWVMSDSTIDHNNYNYNYTQGAVYCGRATALLTRKFREAGVDAVIDAVCGSGFAAMSASGEHFRARLSARRKCADPPDAIVLMGGWNDAGWSESVIQLAIQGACCMAHRCLSRGVLDDARS